MRATWQRSFDKRWHVAIVLLLGVLGLALSLQGWRALVPGDDAIPYIDGARALLTKGVLPDHGHPTSYHSYAPPGAAWIVLPGVWLLSDVRLFDVPGNVLLHLGTLFGIFVLARACCGVRCALLSVVLYGISEQGLLFAHSYGIKGRHEFFYVWMAYWTCWWVARSDSRYLAAALMTWVAGMYVFLEMAPAVFMLPVVWIVYRPPVRLLALTVAGVFGLVMWFPYLRFEATRGFADLRSQMLLQYLEPESPTDTFCDSTLTLRRWGRSSAEPAGGGNLQPARRIPALMRTSGRRVLAIVGGLVKNFEGRVPGAQLVLLALTLAGVLAASARPMNRAPPVSHGGRERGECGRSWLTALATSLLICSGLASSVVIGRALGFGPWAGTEAASTIRTLQAMAALGALAILMRRSIARWLAAPDRVDPTPCDPRVLALALVVPWALLLLIVEYGRGDRFVGLWPLQTILLAFGVGVVSARAGHARLTRWATPLLVIGLTIANPLRSSQVEAWRRDRWSGSDAVEIRVADYLATLIRSEHKDRAVIGRRLFFDGPAAHPWRAVDGRWRSGVEFDVSLEYRHGLTNLNQCGEGLSAEDEYRIVETQPSSPDDAYYFDVRPSARLQFLDQIGNYQVFGRNR